MMPKGSPLQGQFSHCSLIQGGHPEPGTVGTVAAGLFFCLLLHDFVDMLLTSSLPPHLMESPIVRGEAVVFLAVVKKYHEKCLNKYTNIFPGPTTNRINIQIYLDA